MHENFDIAPAWPRVFPRRVEHEPAAPQDDVTFAEFLRDVHAGLEAPQKELPCKYFYDARGSALFNQICATPEYYPTAAEKEILRSYADELGFLAGSGVDVVELGSCNSEKFRILLPHLREPRSYTPVDVSETHLAACARSLRQDFPALRVAPLTADFTKLDALPDDRRRGKRTLFFFAGSTIGNLHPREASALLQRVTALARRSFFLVGVDTVKTRATLERAYNDKQGVTAAFNLNMLARINAELGGDFALDAFRHVAFFNADESRIEMHLESTREQTVRVGGRAFSFARGERIHTENSYKYATSDFQRLARGAGLLPARTWLDSARRFSLHLLVRGSALREAGTPQHWMI